MKPKTKYIVLIVVLMLAALACNLPGGSQSGGQLPDGLTENYELPSGTLLSGDFNYSAAQEAVLQEHGNPTRFIILFGEAARQETWFYDADGYSVVFRDGEKVSEKTEEAVYKEGMYATTYSSDLFYRGMSVDEIVLSTGRNKFMLTSVPDLEGMRLMDLEGLTIGLVGGKISYVETIPALTETLLTPEDFAQLTAEEAANEGEHTYIASFTIEGEGFQEDFGIVEFSFQTGQLTMMMEGDALTLNQTGTNTYFTEVDGGISVTFTAGGFNLIMEEGTPITLTRTDGQAASAETSPEQPTPAASQTPEELANEGVHFYVAHYSVNGENFEEDFGEIEIVFYEEEFTFTFEGETILFNQTEPNQYYADADGGLSITFSMDGFVFFSHSDNTDLILTRQD